MIDINVNSSQIFSLFMEREVPIPCGLSSSVNFYDSSVKDICIWILYIREVQSDWILYTEKVKLV